MCGIAGVALKSGNAVSEVYGGLKRLEYRGYDSVGIAALCENKLTVVKRKGRVAELKTAVETLSGKTAIGHTRWATHGAPCVRNAHPHVCGKIAVVHNGIIENFRELKKELEGQNHTFSSDTDSEVIAHLIDINYSQSEKSVPLERLISAVADSVKRLNGSFAIAVLCEDFDGIIAARYKSNAVVGFLEDGVCLSSDIPALPTGVDSVVVLEDGDVAAITAQNVTFYDFNLQPAERRVRKISPVQLSLGKGSYPHFMLKEIYEAERTVTDTAEGFFRINLPVLQELIAGADKIVLTGCGTAYNAALAAVRYFEERCDCFCVAEVASELRYKKVRVTEKTLLLVVTQSGETADVVGAAEEFKKLGAKVVAITNCGYSAITLIADLVVPVCAGAEICVAATKSYLGQLAALYLTASLARGVEAAQAAKGELLEVASLFGQVFNDDKSAELAKDCIKSRAVFFLGRGYDSDAAVEAALKLKEVSYIFSDSYPAGELKHGTLALVDGETLSVIIVGDERFADKSESTIEQIISRGGRAAVITDSGAVAARLAGRAKVWLLPKSKPALSIMLSAAALQLTAYRAAVLLERNPDKPRNLAKSVTVE
ncbi:MAG: glutamine--fructose-6-phosphate transaminase (isomerizing) [Candidatus Coproplasma sp.]